MISDLIKALAEPNELTVASQGNASFAVGPSAFRITPSNIWWTEMNEDKFRRVDFGENEDQSTFNKMESGVSSEWRLHRQIYALNPLVTSILHTHPVYSTIVSDLDIPFFVGEHPSVLVRRLMVKFQPSVWYPNDNELLFREIDPDRTSAYSQLLLRGHGLVVVSTSHLDESLYHHSTEVERLAKVAYHTALYRKLYG